MAEFLKLFGFLHYCDGQAWYLSHWDINLPAIPDSIYPQDHLTGLSHWISAYLQEDPDDFLHMNLKSAVQKKR
jgi:hypothetical protein